MYFENPFSGRILRRISLKFVHRQSLAFYHREFPTHILRRHWIERRSQNFSREFQVSSKKILSRGKQSSKTTRKQERNSQSTCASLYCHNKSYKLIVDIASWCPPIGQLLIHDRFAYGRNNDRSIVKRYSS